MSVNSTEAHFAATVSVLQSPDHYRAQRLARLFDELAKDEKALNGRLRARFSADAELARQHAADLKGGGS